MFHIKLSIVNLLFMIFYNLLLCSAAENINKQENHEQLNKTIQDNFVKNDTNLRSGRTLIQHSRMPAYTLRHRQPIKIRAKADHFPLRTQMRRVHNNLPNGQSQQQNMRFGYESLKSSKYLPSSKGTNLQFSNNAKGSSYRPQLLGGHPNAIQLPALSQQYVHNFKASPAYNGQVVMHPVAKAQKQQPPATQQNNSYPKYIKTPQKAALAAVTSSSSSSSAQTHNQKQQQKQPQQQPALQKYPEFKQYPIPDHEKLQQYNEQHEKYLQQQKFLTPKNPLAYYDHQHNQQQKQQHQQQELQAQPQSQTLQNYAVQTPLQFYQQSQQQQQQQPSIPIHESVQQTNNIPLPAAAASVPSKMYSVYEENDMTELHSNNYQTAAYQELDKEAQDYLRFMNTDDYFLPKKEPNYKRIDDETDKRQYNVLKVQAQQHLRSLQQPQQPAISYQQSPSQPTAYQQHVYTPPTSPQSAQYANSLYSDLTDTSSYTQGNPISRLFYQQEPSTATSDSSTVVRSSYQTGYNQNQFVVNSKDSKIGKYTIPPTSTPSTFAISTQSPILYPQLRHNTPGNRTPEPLRFEFTERDAMIGNFAYTRAPQGQLKYNDLTSNSVTRIAPKTESPTVVSDKTQNYFNARNTIRPVLEEGEDDPEEGDDMQEAGTNIFGRQPVVRHDLNSNKKHHTTELPPSDQKDTEEYCERICAIVEDENEEIVCGSDGYMYTSEAQMECYASCLHIDVTIQGKGSCSTL